LLTLQKARVLLVDPEMKIQPFKDIKAWHLAHELKRKFCHLKKPEPAKYYGQKRQIQDTGIRSTHNIA